MKMILTRGLPSSGKTTFANELVAADPTYVRVNRDDIRFMLYGKYVLDSRGEAAVTVIQHGAIENALKTGLNVVVDDTNFFTRGVNALLKIAQKYDAEVEFKDFTHVTVDECIFRDKIRGANGERAVGQQVIEKMYDRYLKGRKLPLPEPKLATYELKPYEISPEPNILGYNGKPWAVIVDLDGTVAKMAGRSPYDWASVGEDSPVQDVLSMVHAMSASGYKVLFTSGRDGSCRDITEKWIRLHYSQFGWELFMREAKDQRPDWIVKAEIFDREIRDKYNVRCVFDDRDQVVRMWRKLGLTVAQVAEGDF